MCDDHSATWHFYFVHYHSYRSSTLCGKVQGVLQNKSMQCAIEASGVSAHGLYDVCDV